MVVNKIYFSPTGGTKKVIDTMADACECEKKEIDLAIPHAKYDQVDIHEEDVCMIAVPVFEGRVPKTIVPRLKQIRGNRATAVLIAVYGARAVDDAMIELRDICMEQGFRCRAAVAAVAEHSIMKIYGKDRPNQEDCLKLKEFSKQIQDLYQKNALPECVKVMGKRPYIEMGGVPVKPSGNENCIQCGICASACPAEAITSEDFRVTDSNKCILCMRCVTLCPVHARDFDPALIKMFQEKMRPAFAGERHNELFISEVES